MRKTFFSFHYERDSWRAGQVRNCNLISSEDQYGFIDAVDWESIQRQGRQAIERWIKDQLKYTSVSVVLIGAETAERPWVRYEILESWNRGNGVLGIWIDRVKDQGKMTDTRGRNPFEDFELPDGTLLASVCKIYDWVADDGRNNLGQWIEEAFKARAENELNERIVEIPTTRRLEKTNVSRAAAVSGGFTPKSPWCPEDGDGSR